jgi:hypothetical protein
MTAASDDEMKTSREWRRRKFAAKLFRWASDPTDAPVGYRFNCMGTAEKKLDP